MNRKLVALILVVLISFCFLSIVVADNVAHDDNNTNHDKTINKDKKVDKKTDKNKTTNKNKMDDKSKKNYILAEGSGNGIMFSDGFRGFILDYSKHPAKSGDEFQRVSTSHAGNSNELKLNIIKSYMQDSTDQIGSIIAGSVKNESFSSKVAEEFEASHETVGDHEVVRIDSRTEAVFDFEVLKSVSGNVSDYFAYKVSFRAINVNQTNVTNATNTTNVTNTTNITNLTQPMDNQTNATFLKGLYDYLAFLANLLFNAWKPIIGTLINNFLMLYNALGELVNLFANFLIDLQALMDALGELLKMLESLWKELDGLLKLLAILMNLIQQLLDLIQAIIDFILQLIDALIALLMELLEWLYALIQFLIDLINQLIALIQAILAFLKALGSLLINVIESAVIIITTFVIITIGAFVYNRIR